MPNNTIALAQPDCSNDFDFFPSEQKAERTKIRTDCPRLRDQYQEEFRQYNELFIERCDRRAYNTRLGYWNDDTPIRQQYGPIMAHTWQPARRKGGAYLPATVDALADKVERHLDPQYWQHRGHRAKGYKQPYWLGILGSITSKSFAYDVDNHNKLVKYSRNGANLLVPDLNLSTLEHLKKLLELPYESHGLPQPTALTTSSDSLGLNLWLLPDGYRYTREFVPKMQALAAEHGIPKQECYPMPPGKSTDSPYAGRNVHRRPCGQGTAALTASYILTGWRDQLANFLNPEPLPSIEVVAEQLIELWRLSFLRWRVDFLDCPGSHLDHYHARCQEIRNWIKDEQPQLSNLVCELPVPKTASKTVEQAPVVQYPTDWENYSYPERLYRIAISGCPGNGLLNWCIVQLVRHLMTYELVELEIEERAALTMRIVSSWVLSKHNNCSGRIDATTCCLPSDIEKVIARDILAVTKQKTENKTVLRLRSLITGEGAPNGFLPHNTPRNTEDLYCVSHSGIHDRFTQKQFPPEVQDKLRQLAGRKPARALDFALRFATYLDSQGGKARINRDIYMPLFLGGTNPNQWNKFKTISIKAGVIAQTDSYHKGVKSNEFQLLVKLEDKQRIS